jgi:hypothetical protein
VKSLAERNARLAEAVEQQSSGSVSSSSSSSTSILDNLPITQNPIEVDVPSDITKMPKSSKTINKGKD